MWYKWVESKLGDDVYIPRNRIYLLWINQLGFVIWALKNNLWISNILVTHFFLHSIFHLARQKERFPFQVKKKFELQ